MTPCTSCGAESPPQFSYCGYCGTALERAEHSSAPVHDTRRQVTIVFSDLKGSTALGERLDSEALRQVITRYFEEMSAALERHGGTVEKFIGDAIMAVFGMPTAHEDDALRAVRGALEMKERLEVLNVELEKNWGVTLANRTGVNTGTVIASSEAGTRQRLVTGDTVNVAARLEQAAPAQEVLIGEPTYRLVRDYVEVEEVEALELKGKSERVPAYRLLSVTEGAARRRHTLLPLVGRERELAVLSGLLDDAVAQRTCLLVKVVADAGTGKSRLIEEVMALAGTRGGIALRGRCLQYGSGITFWPLIEMVAEAVGIGREDAPEVARGKIAALVDDRAVSDRVAAAVGLSEAPFPLDELYWGVRKLLEAIAADGPLVAVFEDLHWAEPALLEMLTNVAQASTGAPVLVVGTGRPELEERHPDWPELDGRGRDPARAARRRRGRSAGRASARGHPPGRGAREDRLRGGGQPALRRAARRDVRRRGCPAPAGRRLGGLEGLRRAGDRPGLDRRAARGPPRPAAPRRAHRPGIGIGDRAQLPGRARRGDRPRGARPGAPAHRPGRVARTRPSIRGWGARTSTASTTSSFGTRRTTVCRSASARPCTPASRAGASG